MLNNFTDLKIFKKLNFISLLLPLIITACGSTDSPSQNCEIKNPATNVQTSAKNVALWNYEIPQIKISNFMQLTNNDTVCFLSKQEEPITVHRVSSGRKKSKYFSYIAEANALHKSVWRNMQDQLSKRLMGLANIHYWLNPSNTYQIHETHIYVADDSRPWHLWHEYGHYVAKKDLFTRQLFRPVRSKEDIVQQRKAINHKITQIENTSGTSVALQDLEPLANEFTSHYEQLLRYIQQGNLEEVLIEMLIWESLSQARSLKRFNFKPLDLEDSVRFINQFQRYAKDDIYKTLQTINRLDPLFRNTQFHDDLVTIRSELETIIEEMDVILLDVLRYKSELITRITQ